MNTKILKAKIEHDSNNDNNGNNDNNNNNNNNNNHNNKLCASYILGKRPVQDEPPKIQGQMDSFEF